MNKYKLVYVPEPFNFQYVINTETCAQIPFDPANTDYQEYLKWVAEGNTPTPADE
jgi:hypothetical protein